MHRRLPTAVSVVASVLVALSLVACVDPGTTSTADQALASTEPDPDLTPGSLCTPAHRDFDGYRYEEHIAHCRRNVSSGRKRAVYEAYGIPSSQRYRYQIDHRVPLSIGGDNATTNLWPLLDADARRKASLEQSLYDDVSAGDLSQADAIAIILAWR